MWIFQQCMMHVTSRQFLKTSQVPLIVSQLDSNMTQCDLGTSLLFCHTHNYIYHIYGKKEFLTLDTSCKFSPNRFLYDLITLSWAIRNEKEEGKKRNGRRRVFVNVISTKPPPQASPIILPITCPHTTWWGEAHCAINNGGNHVHVGYYIYP